MELNFKKIKFKKVYKNHWVYKFDNNYINVLIDIIYKNNKEGYDLLFNYNKLGINNLDFKINKISQLEKAKNIAQKKYEKIFLDLFEKESNDKM